MKINSHWGTTQDDVLKGGRGTDLLYGLQGNDVLKGGQGDDYLFSGAGTDILVGGPGRDHFVFNMSSIGEAADIIRDFQPGKDTLVIIDYEADPHIVGSPISQEAFDTAFNYDEGILRYQGQLVSKMGALSHLDITILD